MQVLASGQASSWTLPEIEQGDNPLAKIDFEPRADIAHSLTFDDQTLEVSFDGDLKLNGSNENGIYSFIKIKLTDTEGFTSTHLQQIQVYKGTQEEENNNVEVEEQVQPLLFLPRIEEEIQVEEETSLSDGEQEDDSLFSNKPLSEKLKSGFENFAAKVER